MNFIPETHVRYTNNAVVSTNQSHMRANPCYVICSRCHEWCVWSAGRPYCKQCHAVCNKHGIPDGNRRWYSPGYCPCGALMYPFEKGRQCLCRDCNRYIILPRMAPVPPSASDLLRLVDRTPTDMVFGSKTWPEEPEASDVRIAIIRDMYRLCMPDIRFLRIDLPLSFYAPWHNAFNTQNRPIAQALACMLLEPYTRS